METVEAGVGAEDGPAGVEEMESLKAGMVTLLVVNEVEVL